MSKGDKLIDAKNSHFGSHNKELISARSQRDKGSSKWEVELSIGMYDWMEVTVSNFGVASKDEYRLVGVIAGINEYSILETLRIWRRALKKWIATGKFDGKKHKRAYEAVLKGISH